MSDFACPKCGEDDRIRGQRRGDLIRITCEACGHSWERDPRRRCVYCDSQDLRYTPMPLWTGGRGTMQTPAGTREAWTCEDCGASDATRPKS